MIEAFDWEDSNNIIKFSLETVTIAQSYSDARVDLGQTKARLYAKLARFYKDGKISRTLAIEKALLEMTNIDESTKDDHQNYIALEETVKGLEQLINARKAHTKTIEALIINKVKES